MLKKFLICYIKNRVEFFPKKLGEHARLVVVQSNYLHISLMQESHLVLVVDYNHLFQEGWKKLKL